MCEIVNKVTPPKIIVKYVTQPLT